MQRETIPGEVFEEQWRLLNEHKLSSIRGGPDVQIEMVKSQQSSSHLNESPDNLGPEHFSDDHKDKVPSAGMAKEDAESG